MESGPWTIVHGIKTQGWSMESGPWTIVHGIDRRELYRHQSMANRKLIIDYSP